MSIFQVKDLNDTAYFSFCSSLQEDDHVLKFSYLDQYDNTWYEYLMSLADFSELLGNESDYLVVVFKENQLYIKLAKTECFFLFALDDIATFLSDLPDENVAREALKLFEAHVLVSMTKSKPVKFILPSTTSSSN